MTEVTLGQFIDNMEKNGFPQIKMKMWNRGEGGLTKIVAGCALGQAIYNTVGKSVYPNEMSDTLWNLEADVPYRGRSEFVRITTYMNDVQDMTILEIAQKLREIFSSKLDTIIWTLPE